MYLNSNNLLRWSELKGRPYLEVNDPTLPDFITCGFSGRDFFSEYELKEELSINKIHSLNQVHGKELCNITEANLNKIHYGDGWLLSFSKLQSLDKTIFTIRTADCLPIIMIGTSGISLIHAGWRGLASGIIREGYLKSEKLEFNIQTIIIGPAADGKLYEVGPEVAKCFPPESLKKLPASDKSMLDLYVAAKLELNECQFKGELICSPCKTISDNRFYSYRAEGKAAGRNLLFSAINL
jgi:copper oxidase (laccase) domain-containing protein